MSALRDSEQVDTPKNTEVPSKQKPDLSKVFEILSNEVCGMPETFSITKSQCNLFIPSLIKDIT